MSQSQSFGYGIGPGMLRLGIAALAGCLVLLLALALDGLPSGWLWWTMTAVVALSLGLSIAVAVATRRAGPVRVVLESDAIVVPGGAVGTRPRRVGYESIRGLRMVGRASLVRRDSLREVLYILHDERYSILMSEMFEGWDAYARCRDALVTRVREARPDARIDRDGRPVEPSDR